MSDEYLYEQPGEQLTWGPNGPERIKLQPEMGPLERSSSNFLSRRGIGGTVPVQANFRVAPQAAPATRSPTPDELLRRATEALDAAYQQRAILPEIGSSVGERDAAGGKIPDWLANAMKKNDTD